MLHGLLANNVEKYSINNSWKNNLVNNINNNSNNLFKEVDIQTQEMEDMLKNYLISKALFIKLEIGIDSMFYKESI